MDYFWSSESRMSCSCSQHDTRVVTLTVGVMPLTVEHPDRGRGPRFHVRRRRPRRHPLPPAAVAAAALVPTRADRKSQVRQCFGFCSAHSYAKEEQKSAVQKPKHCLI